VDTRIIGLGLLLTLQPSMAPPQRASNPFAENALDPAGRHWRQGRVIERIVTGPYAYLRLREASGQDVWLVSLAATAPTTDDVRVFVLGQAEHFHSRRLHRDFDRLLFAAVRPAITRTP
jgi:hypothetical protein